MLFGRYFDNLDINIFVNEFKSRMKNNLYKKKRLGNFSRYFKAKEDNREIEFIDNDECLTYIIEYLNKNDDNSEEIIQELLLVLDQSVSNRNPHYTMDFDTDKSIYDFHDYIAGIFRNVIRNDDCEYTISTEIYLDDINQIIEVECDYKELVVDMDSGNEYKKSIGIIKLYFDLKNKKYISSKAGNRKIHNNIYDFLIGKGIALKPLYILKRAQTIKNKNQSEFAASTLLVANLLFNSFKGMELNFNLEFVDFINMDAPNVQGMTLKGTKLLMAPEILQRIHNGDEIFKFKVSIEKLYDENGDTYLFSTTFEVNFEGKISFIFNEDVENSELRYSTVMEIHDELKRLIYNERTIEIGIEIINENLPKPKSMQLIINDLYADVIKLIKNKDEKIAIEKYFLEKYPMFLIK